MRRLLPLLIPLLVLSGCFRELALLTPQGGASGDAMPDADGAAILDAATDAGPRDGGRPDAGDLDAGHLDAGGLDAGPLDGGGPASCLEPVTEATLCLSQQTGFSGAEVAVPIILTTPIGCEGVGRQSGTLQVDGATLTLLNVSSTGCVLRTQDGDTVNWRQLTREDGEVCPPLYGAGTQDILRFRIAAETIPGSYPLRWQQVRVEESPLPSTCAGEDGVDGAIVVGDG